MTDSIKNGVESLPLIEKITNLHSTLLVLVLLFTVDLCLLWVTGTNLLTYPWQLASQNIHHGKIALLFGVSLFCYVVVLPAINGVLWELAAPFEWHVLRHIVNIFKSSDKEDHEYRKGLNDRENVPTWALKRWAAENHDSFAYELTKENTAAHQRHIRTSFAINHASAALMLLLWVESETHNSVWFEVVKWINQHIAGELRFVCMAVLVLSSFIPCVSWWFSRKLGVDDSKVYYPKAAIERYEANRKRSSSRHL